MSFGLGAGLALNNTELVFTDALYDRAVVNLQDSVVDSRITFTRASDRSYFDSDGVLQYATTDEWPLEYDPATGLVLGRSVWAAATNLLLRSEEFDNAEWVKSLVGGGSAPVVTANAAVAPDGTTTADQVVFEAPTSSDQSILSDNSITVSNATAYTGSVWVKAKDPGDIGKIIGLRHVGAATYSLITLTADWVRVSVTETSVSTSAAFTLILRPAVGTSTGTVSCYMWGAQLETGSIATPYIPTAGGTVTRAADSAVISTLSSIGFNASEGSLIVSGSAPAVLGADNKLCSFDDGTANERITLQHNGTGIRLLVTDGGVAQVSATGGAASGGSSFAVAAAYKLNDFAISVNGAAAVTDASGTLPTVDRLVIGSDGIASSKWNGYIRSLTYVPRRLADADLVSLSKV